MVPIEAEAKIAFDHKKERRRKKKKKKERRV